ncbi:aldolase/citrate lyase family protein [Leifsonia poae]|uniref:aldolase/citrate lyase family protein n=1 Tax=Leifsonia poae TaxID=110933 RepID=UPI001CBE1F82|nr:aldolase/citrate lyase family protein [Leifsonia poae]
MSKRTSPLVALLEEDKPTFALWVNYYGVGADYQTAAAAQANKNYDFLLYDLEHQPYDLGQLRRFLWDLIDPAEVAAVGRGAIKPVIARLPSNGREPNEWVVKQVLDTGVAGIMMPHIETAEEALSVVAAARYPQKPAAPDFLPEGHRGFSPAVPQRYWGFGPMEIDDFLDAADVWGLDPAGELVLVFIIESRLGVENIREIARALSDANVKAILWAGGGDLSLSYGESFMLDNSPNTIAGIEAILAAGKEFGLPVGMNHTLQAETDYAKGARAFFSIGPSSLGGAPTTPEVRAALGRS